MTKADQRAALTVHAANVCNVNVTTTKFETCYTEIVQLILDVILLKVFQARHLICMLSNAGGFSAFSDITTGHRLN